MLGNLEKEYNIMLADSEYITWKINNPSAALLYETYVTQLLLGNSPSKPKTKNGKCLGLVQAARITSITPEDVIIVPPPQTYQFSFPENPMTFYNSGGGKYPIVTPDGSGIVFEATYGASNTISRAHWSDSGKKVGDKFSLIGRVAYDSGVYGVVFRVENFKLLNGTNRDMNQLGLTRYKNDGKWYVTFELFKPIDSTKYQYVTLLSGMDIPNGSMVEFRGILGDVDGQALTEVLVNGALVGSSTKHNWAMADQLIDRIRVGIVDGTNTNAGKVTVSELKFF